MGLLNQPMLQESSTFLALTVNQNPCGHHHCCPQFNFQHDSSCRGRPTPTLFPPRVPIFYTSRSYPCTRGQRQSRILDRPAQRSGLVLQAASQHVTPRGKGSTPTVGLAAGASVEKGKRSRRSQCLWCHNTYLSVFSLYQDAKKN